MKTAQPHLLTTREMYETLQQTNTLPEKHYFRNGLAIVIDGICLFKPFLNISSSPFLLQDYRLGIVKAGRAETIINLQPVNLGPGSAVFFTPGSIVQPLRMDDDFQVVGTGIPADLFHIAHASHLPEIFSMQARHGAKQFNEKQLQLADHMFRLFCELAADGTSQQAVYGALTAITGFFNDVFSVPVPSSAPSRSANEIFDRFLHLVNLNCRTERQLSFYAERICVTERYLGTAVRDASGVTAKEWIDRAVITAAKVLLRHSNKQVSEISAELHFPNPSFFCKYFRRLTGMSPHAFRDARE